MMLCVEGCEYGDHLQQCPDVPAHWCYDYANICCQTCPALTIEGAQPGKVQLISTKTYLSQSKVYVYVDLYSACLRKAPQMRSDMDHTVLPANYTMPAFTPQPQCITALWLVLILLSHGG